MTEIGESTTTIAPPSTTETVYEAVRELVNSEQRGTRQNVCRLTGLKLSIVDDRLRELHDCGRLNRVERGVYELVPVYPRPRPISRTVLEDGTVKYEIGDDILTLTPQEDRRLADSSAGAAASAVAITRGRETMISIASLDARLTKHERDLKMLRQWVKNTSLQGELPLLED